MFLFFAGLVVFLRPINIVVANIVLVVVSAVGIVYVFFTILPTVANDVPFQTPFSAKLWRLFFPMLRVVPRGTKGLHRRHSLISSSMNVLVARVKNSMHAFHTTVRQRREANLVDFSVLAGSLLDGSRNNAGRVLNSVCAFLRCYTPHIPTHEKAPKMHENTDVRPHGGNTTHPHEETADEFRGEAQDKAWNKAMNTIIKHHLLEPHPGNMMAAMVSITPSVILGRHEDALLRLLWEFSVDYSGRVTQKSPEKHVLSQFAFNSKAVIAGIGIVRSPNRIVTATSLCLSYRFPRAHFSVSERRVGRA
ncbi:hypothetical protein OF83DRAFT_1176670 [Amylostereum chailletii]|nr:hypothetical protein OF83DRAFT_1176670 [Amylostereum chailletii]